MPIIINGGSRSAGGWWTQHLGDTKKNERAELIEITGLSAATTAEAFREMYGVSLGTKCTNYFYQANINPREDEHLTPAQWREAVDTLEKNLGLTGQPRFVVEHEKEGRTHRHVVWSRIDPERMTAISDSLTAAIHERTSRELEIRFDLERGRSVLTRDREFERPARRPQKHETFRALETGIDPQMVKAEVSALWRSADNGPSFKAALEASGYILARGDRRDFVIIDRAGDDHSLARRAGVKAAEVRARMSGIDPASLPSVAEARAEQRERQAERDINHQAGIDHQAAPVIDLQSGRERRYGPVEQTHREVAREQFEGRYDALRAAEPPPEVVQSFAAAATQTAEPVAPIYDRDAADAIWAEKVAAAGIAKDEATRETSAVAEATAHTRAGAGEALKEDMRPPGQARRPSVIEARITECAEQARTSGAVIERDGESVTVFGPEAFAARLDQAGIAVARVTAADVIALDALRQDENMARLAAETNREARKAHHFAELAPGDLAAVLRNGDVYRIDPDKLAGADKQFAADLPSVTEARAAFESDREQTAELWAERRAAAAAHIEGRADEHAILDAAMTAQHAKQGLVAAAEEAVEQGFKAARGLLGGIAKLAEGALGFLSGWFDTPKPPPSPEEYQREAVAADEAARLAEFRAYVAEQERRLDTINEQIHEQQQDDLAIRFGTPPPGRSSERARDDDDRGYERER